MKIRRGISALLACATTSAMILVATPPLASADVPVSRDLIPLINLGSGKCFAPTPQDGHSVDWSGLLIQQRTCDPSNRDQHYILEAHGFVPFNDQGWFPCWGCIELGDEGYFIMNLKNQNTRLCMDARDGATNDGSVVQQWECRDKTARSMVWYLEPGDFAGTFKVKNLNSDLCLDVRGGSSDEYAQLQQYHCTSNNPAQNFRQSFATMIDTVIDLNGSWTDGSTQSAVISVAFTALAIDMSAFNRPVARGWIDDTSTITVTFPDNATFTGHLVPPNRIIWSNGSEWTKLP